MTTSFEHKLSTALAWSIFLDPLKDFSSLEIDSLFNADLLQSYFIHEHIPALKISILINRAENVESIWNYKK